MSTTATISFHPPTRMWSTNQVNAAHWRASHRDKVRWRDDTGGTLALYFRSKWGVNRPAIVEITLPFERNVRRDPSNYVSTHVKWLVDGMVKGGLWPDDNPKYVTVTIPTLVVGKGEQVTVTLKERPDDG